MDEGQEREEWNVDPIYKDVGCIYVESTRYSAGKDQESQVIRTRHLKSRHYEKKRRKKESHSLANGVSRMNNPHTHMEKKRRRAIHMIPRPHMIANLTHIIPNSTHLLERRMRNPILHVLLSGNPAPVLSIPHTHAQHRTERLESISLNRYSTKLYLICL
jgi:hypothetical protein